MLIIVTANKFGFSEIFLILIFFKEMRGPFGSVEKCYAHSFFGVVTFCKPSATMNRPTSTMTVGIRGSE